MRRILFLILYTFILLILWPGKTLAQASEQWPFPPQWVNALLVPGSIVLFTVAIYLASRLFRHWNFHRPRLEQNWMQKRQSAGTGQGGLPPVPARESNHRYIFPVYTVVLLSIMCEGHIANPERNFHTCVEHGHFLSADFLALAGAKPSALDLTRFCNNNSPIFRNKEEQTRAVAYLLENGCNPNTPNFFGSPVEFCLNKPNRHLLPLLLKHGASLQNTRGFHHLPPASVAAQNGEPEFLSYLLDNGADASARAQAFYDYKTPLHIACSWTNRNQAECVKILLDAGADVNALDSYGRTPLDLLDGHPADIAKLLREHGALPAKELVLTLKEGDSDLTDRLKAANPQGIDTELQGLLVIGNDDIPYTYTHTSKGNGFITIPAADGMHDIRCYDAHDNGSIYKGHWAQIVLEDKNNDGFRDIVVTGIEEETDDNGNPTRSKPFRMVYPYSPERKVFLTGDTPDGLH